MVMQLITLGLDLVRPFPLPLRLHLRLRLDRGQGLLPPHLVDVRNDGNRPLDPGPERNGTGSGDHWGWVRDRGEPLLRPLLGPPNGSNPHSLVFRLHLFSWVHL